MRMKGSSGKSPHVCEKSADGEESRMKQGGNGLENGENVPILSGAILRSREILCKNKAPPQAKACGGAVLLLLLFLKKNH